MKKILSLYLASLLASLHCGCQQNSVSSINGEETMHVKIVSLDQCSATGPTIALVEETARNMGITISLEHIIVRTPAEAEQHRHIGSPTVLIEGVDIEPQARDINNFGVT